MPLGLPSHKKTRKSHKDEPAGEYMHDRKNYPFSCTEANTLFYASGLKPDGGESIKPLKRRGSFYNEFHSCNAFAHKYQKLEPEDFSEVPVYERQIFRENFDRFEKSKRTLPAKWENLSNAAKEWEITLNHNRGDMEAAKKELVKRKAERKAARDAANEAVRRKAAGKVLKAVKATVTHGHSGTSRRK
jgi:hypothetical protein